MADDTMKSGPGFFATLKASRGVDTDTLSRLLTALIDSFVPKDRQIEAWAVAEAIDHHFVEEVRRQNQAAYQRGVEATVTLYAEQQHQLEKAAKTLIDDVILSTAELTKH